MIPIDLPKYSFRIKKVGQSKYIFDNIRKKYVKLTPEEGVRQQFIQFLIIEKAFKPALISVELPLQLNELQKRSDIVLYDNTGKIRVLVECKAPEIKLSEAVFEQVKRYNMQLKADFLLITNGNFVISCFVDYSSGEFRFLEYIPSFEQVLSLD